MDIVTVLEVDVPGVPVPQGSMKHLGPGRMVHSNAAALLPWRASVIAHIRQQMDKGGTWPVEGPLKVGVTFYLPRPKSVRAGVMWPAVRPDIDKLLRAALDSLTQSGAIRDDGQVVQVGVTKAYGQPGMCLTMRPMAVAAVAA